MQPDDLEALVLDHLTEEFLTGAIRAVFQARDLADRFCAANFEEAEAENLRPLIARAKVNEYLRVMTDRIPNCTARVAHSDGSSIQRTELASGPIRLTAHAVQYPCGKVKEYQYRRSLAEGNAPTLFDMELPLTDTLYAVLLHGPYRPRNLTEVGSYRGIPGSIYLAFPSAELKDYAYRIDLIGRYQSLVNTLLPSEWGEDAKVFYRWQAAARDVG